MIYYISNTQEDLKNNNKNHAWLNEENNVFCNLYKFYKSHNQQRITNFKKICFFTTFYNINLKSFAKDIISFSLIYRNNINNTIQIFCTVLKCIIFYGIM